MKVLFFILLMMVGSSWAMEEKNTDLACGICRVDLKEGEGAGLCPTDKHDFHKECLNPWRFPHQHGLEGKDRTTCPTCYQELRTPFLESTPCILISSLTISAVLLLLSSGLSS